MSREPITKVYDEAGEILHDCEAAGCEHSWDGYVLATGEPLEGREDPGKEWKVGDDGTARRTQA